MDICGRKICTDIVRLEVVKVRRGCCKWIFFALKSSQIFLAVNRWCRCSFAYRLGYDLWPTYEYAAAPERANWKSKRVKSILRSGRKVFPARHVYFAPRFAWAIVFPLWPILAKILPYLLDVRSTLFWSNVGRPGQEIYVQQETLCNSSFRIMFFKEYPRRTSNRCGLYSCIQLYTNKEFSDIKFPKIKRRDLLCPMPNIEQATQISDRLLLPSLHQPRTILHSFTLFITIWQTACPLRPIAQRPTWIVYIFRSQKYAQTCFDQKVWIKLSASSFNGFVFTWNLTNYVGQKSIVCLLLIIYGNSDFSGPITRCGLYSCSA